MFVYSNQPANLTINLGVDATDVHWKVENEDGATVIPEAWSLTDSAGNLNLTIPGENNVIPESQLRGFRVIFITYKSAGQTLYKEESYAVTHESELVVQKNSFQTYNQSLFTAYGLTGLESFGVASKEQKILALENAWRNLVNLRYYINRDITAIRMSRVVDFPGQELGDLTELNASEFEQLDPRFIEALRRAQILEADYIISGKADGKFESTSDVTSRKIGEAEETYKISSGVGGANSARAVSARARNEIRGYLETGVKTGRA